MGGSVSSGKLFRRGTRPAGWGNQGGIKGGTPGATTCARNRTLVACVRSIDDGSELELELVNGGTRRTKG